MPKNRLTEFIEYLDTHPYMDYRECLEAFTERLRKEKADN